MPKPLKDEAVASLAHELRATTGKLARALREHGGRLGLTASQAETLGHVYRDGPMTVTALAKLQGVRSQSVGATVAVLEELGLVAIKPDPDDGRQKVIHPTKKGTKLIDEHRMVKEDWLAQSLATRFTPDEQRRIRDAVALLNRLTES